MKFKATSPTTAAPSLRLNPLVQNSLFLLYSKQPHKCRLFQGVPDPEYFPPSCSSRVSLPPFPHFYLDLPFPSLRCHHPCSAHCGFCSAQFLLLVGLSRVFLSVHRAQMALVHPGCTIVILHSVSTAIPRWSPALLSECHLTFVGFSCFQVGQTPHSSFCSFP